MSDIVICLDDFTSPTAAKARAKESVERTVLWAKRSKLEFEKQCTKRKLTNNQKPLLLAVIQGGWDKDLRKLCAEKLIEIGFDAYGYGGYAVNEDTGLDMELSDYIAKLIPDTALKFALGNGKPIDIARLRQMGWDLFDCTLPTRDSRHQRLYNFTKAPKKYKDLCNPKTYEYLYINKAMYTTDQSPISKNCDCHTCKNYTRAYLHHLFKIQDTLAYRLATIHNLRHYTKLIQYIRTFEQKEK